MVDLLPAFDLAFDFAPDFGALVVEAARLDEPEFGTDCFDELGLAAFLLVLACFELADPEAFAFFCCAFALIANGNISNAAMK